MPPFDPDVRLATIVVQIQPRRLRSDQAAVVLAELGPLLIDSFNAYFHAQPDRRSEERLDFKRQLQVIPVSSQRAAICPVRGIH
jgi:hypothetical protein